MPPLVLLLEMVLLPCNVVVMIPTLVLVDYNIILLMIKKLLNTPNAVISENCNKKMMLLLHLNLIFPLMLIKEI
jgi:hypothetical protein